jgi:hypothetical protein
MTIDFDVTDKIALITLNRPEALNAMTPEMYQKLSESWVEVRDNPDIWVAVVTGAPQPERTPERQVFSAGADLKLTIPAENDAYHFWQTQENQILNRGLEVWKPVVAGINGLCLAGGMTLLLATDIRVASEHAMFDLSEVKRGILPGNGGTPGNRLDGSAEMPKLSVESMTVPCTTRHGEPAQLTVHGGSDGAVYHARSGERLSRKGGWSDARSGTTMIVVGPASGRWTVTVTVAHWLRMELWALGKYDRWAV